MNDSKIKEKRAKQELEEVLEELDKKIRPFKTLESPLVDWQLYALLRRLGLNKYEILAYVALVQGGPQTISELTGKVSKTGIPQPRAYDIMGSLIKYGLVEESKDAKTKIFRAVPPEEGLDNLMDFFAFAKEQALIRLKSQAEHVRPSYGGIWEVKGWKNILNCAERIASSAKHEILVVTDTTVLMRLIPSLKALYEKNNLMISAVTTLQGKNTEEMLDWFTFMRIRERKLFLMPYMIVDRKYALLWQAKTFKEASAPRVTGQELENTEIVETLIDHFFYTNWKTANILTDDLNKELVRKYPLSLCNILTAIDEIELLLRKNQIPEVTAVGSCTKTGEGTNVVGKVLRTQSNWDKKIFSVVIEDSKGRSWSIGGMEAIFEDVSADTLLINIGNE